MTETHTTTTSDITKFVKDAAYITIGLGVIALQKAQVQRQELKKQLDAQIAEAKGGFEKLSGTVEDRVKLVEERIAGLEDQVDQLLDSLEGALPEQARELVHQARAAAKDAQGQIRELVGRNGRAA